MATRILNGPRRYAELDTGAASTAFANAPATQSSSDPSVPQTSNVLTPNMGYNPTTTPFSRTTTTNNPYINQGAPGSGNIIPSSQRTSNFPPQVRRRSSKSKGMDNDKIPRPEIIAEASYNPIQYTTSDFGTPAPASYTNFVTIDDGNAGPRYVRPSFYKVPTDDSLLNATHIPFGMVIQPLADPVAGEEAAPLVECGESGPFRCARCRGYINSNWVFIQGGSTAVCNLCQMQNPVPKDLYCPLDANGNRTDKYERPELYKGVFEFLAPASYHTRKLVTPSLLFCVEASTASYMTGIFHQVMMSIQSLLDYLPCPELTSICIVTYDTGINFFRVPDDLSKDVSVVHVPEVDSSNIPFPKKSLFINVQEGKDKINYLIEKIVKYYESNNRLQKGVTATCFGTALVNSCDLLAEDGGRVLMFGTQAPTTGLGAIKRRDDFKVYGTDKERTLYVPQVEDYSEWAKQWLIKRISVDMFCFAPDYFDLATIGHICNTTGGNIHYYPAYNGTYDGERLHYDLSRNLTRAVAYDAAMTIRNSQGVSFLDYVLPSGRRPVANIECATIDADTTFNVYFKLEEKIKQEQISTQIALLYTNNYGQRVVRVINFKMGTSNDFPTIFKSCDVEAVSQLIIKRNIINISSISVPKIRKDLLDTVVAIFYSYRQNCASTSPATQLVFPEQLKVLPVFFNAIFKSHVLRTMGDIKPDDRSFDLHRFIKMPLNVLSNLWYTKVYALHTLYDNDNEYGAGNVVDDRVIIDSNIPAMDEKLESHGIYLLDNNDTIYIYVKKYAEQFMIQELFGVDSFQEVVGLTNLADHSESYYATKVFNIIDQLRRNKNSSYQPIKIVTEKDAFEPALLNLLVEDERLGESYNAFLCNIHKLIQARL